MSCQPNIEKLNTLEPDEQDIYLERLSQKIPMTDRIHNFSFGIIGNGRRDYSNPDISIMMYIVLKALIEVYPWWDDREPTVVADNVGKRICQYRNKDCLVSISDSVTVIDSQHESTESHPLFMLTFWFHAHKYWERTVTTDTLADVYKFHSISLLDSLNSHLYITADEKTELEAINDSMAQLTRAIELIDLSDRCPRCPGGGLCECRRGDLGLVLVYFILAKCAYDPEAFDEDCEYEHIGGWSIEINGSNEFLYFLPGCDLTFMDADYAGWIRGQFSSLRYNLEN